MKKAFFLMLFCGLTQTVFASAIPQANLKISPSVGAVYSKMVFDASDSRNSDGSTSGIKYRFKFEPSGNWTEFSSSPKTFFTPQHTGNYRAYLQIKNAEGLINTTYQSYKVRGEIGRTARVEVLNPQAIVGESVFFQLHVTVPQGLDQDRVLARWDFDADGKFDTSFSSKKLVSHVYSRAQSLTPFVELKWWDGAVEELKQDYTLDKVLIKESALLPPVFTMFPSYDELVEGTTVTFDASGSRLAKGGWIEWHMGSETIKYKSIISKTFNVPGVHEIVIRNCYNRNNPICREKTISLKIKQKTLASRVEVRGFNQTNPSFSSREGYVFSSVGDRIRFQVTLRRAPGAVYSSFLYRWDFEGDGVFDTDFLKVSSVEYTFFHKGTYVPRVEVLHDKASDFSHVMVGQSRVYVMENTAPHADFSVQQEDVFVRELVSFLAQVRDKEDTVSQLKVRWDVGGDGEWDTTLGAHKSLSWKFDTLGRHKVIMQVLDKGNATHTVEKYIKVLALPTPVARVFMPEISGTDKTIFRFDASESIGRGLEYYWYFPSATRGYEKNISKMPKFSKKLSVLGSNKIYLNIIDQEGRSDALSFDVFVTES